MKDENLRFYAQNDEIIRKDKLLRIWKTYRPRLAKRTSAQRLVVQLTECPVPFRKSLQNLAKVTGL